MLAAPPQTRQWITLFETLDDDEYDGTFGGEHDVEEPVVQMRFHLKETKHAPTII